MKEGEKKVKEALKRAKRSSWPILRRPRKILFQQPRYVETKQSSRGYVEG
jgi:hypothetical protein